MLGWFDLPTKNNIRLDLWKAFSKINKQWQSATGLLYKKKVSYTLNSKSISNVPQNIVYEMFYCINVDAKIEGNVQFLKACFLNILVKSL